MTEAQIGGYRLVKTCDMCPEQYDVYHDNDKIGYLRLRHGVFKAHIPDSLGCEVYRAHPKGDGIFEDDERERYLTEAVVQIDAARKELQLPPVQVEEEQTPAEIPYRPNDGPSNTTQQTRTIRIGNPLPTAMSIDVRTGATKRPEGKK